MAIAKKGARRLVIGDFAFRWTVAPGDEPGMAIVVEAEEKPGQRLVAWVDHGNVISPALVRKAIFRAVEHGWDPRWRQRPREPREMVFRFLDSPPTLMVRWPPAPA